VRLVARGLWHSFAGTEILTNVDFLAHTGQMTAIIGPSGSGKTTLLAILGGLLEPDAGTIAVEPNGTTRAVREHVAFVLQTMNVLPDRSVRDNVALGALGAVRSWAEACDRALDHLASVALDGRWKEPVCGLSGGEVQRVVIARAMASNCDFVLADEPTGQLDRMTTGAVVDSLRQASGARGVIVVTHDEEVAGACDVVWALHDGRLWTR
jgi:putative ABC transport system ATP-binding protein/lipoprotein-releasing system ATP-binding protein